MLSLFIVLFVLTLLAVILAVSMMLSPKMLSRFTYHCQDDARCPKEWKLIFLSYESLWMNTVCFLVFALFLEWMPLLCALFTLWTIDVACAYYRLRTSRIQYLIPAK